MKLPGTRRQAERRLAQIEREVAAILWTFPELRRHPGIPHTAAHRKGDALRLVLGARHAVRGEPDERQSRAVVMMRGRGKDVQ